MFTVIADKRWNAAMGRHFICRFAGAVEKALAVTDVSTHVDAAIKFALIKTGRKFKSPAENVIGDGTLRLIVVEPALPFRMTELETNSEVAA